MKATSDKEADLLVMRIAPEHRENEVALMLSRWWDYRMMHPVMTTYLFADVYLKAHRDWWRRYIDERTADTRELWPSGDIFQERDLTAIWLARRCADTHGIPYEFVMECAIQRSLMREFRHLIRPNQLYTEEFELDLCAAWKARCERTLPRPTSRAYLASGYCRAPAQDAFRAWLVEQVNARPRPHHYLLASLLVDDLVNDAMLQTHWPEERNEAIRYSQLLLQSAA